MFRMRVTASQYIALLNEALQAEDSFRPGMRFYRNPENSKSSAIGVAWFTPFQSMDLAAAVQMKIDKTYEVFDTPHTDS